MKIANVSKHYIQTAEHPPTTWSNGPHWLISITTIGDQPAKPKWNYDKVHRYTFNDVNEPGPTSVTLEQAIDIAATINKALQNNVNTLWVHCDMGICRSGAIAMAAIINQNITHYHEISNKPQPNTLVFNLVRKALGYKYSWET